MPTTFQDLAGTPWSVSLDAFLLDDVRKQTGIDLADTTAGGWQAIQADAGACVRALAVICADEIRTRGRSARDFARGLRGETIEAARAALIAEGADFFPPKEWSAIQSNLQRRIEATQQANELRTHLAALDAMPDEMRQGAAKAIAELLQASAATAMSSPTGQDTGSARGQPGTPSTPATDSQEPAESPPAD